MEKPPGDVPPTPSERMIRFYHEKRNDPGVVSQRLKAMGYNETLDVGEDTPYGVAEMEEFLGGPPQTPDAWGNPLAYGRTFPNQELTEIFQEYRTPGDSADPFKVGHEEYHRLMQTYLDGDQFETYFKGLMSPTIRRELNKAYWYVRDKHTGDTIFSDSEPGWPNLHEDPLILDEFAAHVWGAYRSGEEGRDDMRVQFPATMFHLFNTFNSSQDDFHFSKLDPKVQEGLGMLMSPQTAADGGIPRYQEGGGLKRNRLGEATNVVNEMMNTDAPRS
jgi:hypothetical protein